MIFEQSQFRARFCLTYPTRVDGVGAVGPFVGSWWWEIALHWHSVVDLKPLALTLLYTFENYLELHRTFVSEN